MRQKNAVIVPILTLGWACLSVATTRAVEPPTLEWIRQFGTPRSEYFNGAEVDVFGNVFVSEDKHNAAGTFQGDYVHKFDPTGNLLWTREIGTTDTRDVISGTWVDGTGNLYVSGGGDVSLGRDSYSYLRKYDPAGNVVWSRQTSQQTYVDSGLGNVVGDDLGNLYVCGSTSGALAAPNAGLNDVILAKYDVNGSFLWMRQFGGASFDDAHGVVPDALGNVFLSGSTQSSLSGPPGGTADAFLAKYDDAGNQLWLRQYGGPGYDVTGPLATDGQGNIYATEKLGGYWDASNHVSKYDNEGDLQWSRTLGGTDGGDAFWSISADSGGNVYVNGQTTRSLGGPNRGRTDAFVRKYSSDGEILWTFQLGSAQKDVSYGTAVDDLGNIVIVGSTTGDFAAPFAGGVNGGGDAWVAVLRDSFPGDYDANGVVDAGDHLVWKASFGSTMELTADGNRNGVVDAADYVLWRNNSALSNPSGSANATLIPEPASIVLVGTILALAGSRAMRRRFS